MPKPEYSFVIPVYNRPDEIKELLESFKGLKGNLPYEIIIVEDGSDNSCKNVTDSFSESLNINYFYKSNSGPGDSRNYGMSRACSDYFIILDSDVILDPDYLVAVDTFLKSHPIDCFGGPDGATEDFTDLQKAINFSMTSLWTTGGVRGHKSQKKFQPRSFNMGISRKGFEASGGFGKIHPGEDPDLVLRLWNKEFKTAFIPEAIVYHKRRVSWKLFYKQVFKFGSVRPILNKWHPRYNKLVFWFPTLFIIGLIIAIVLQLYKVPYLLYAYLIYFLIIWLTAIVETRNIKVSLMTIVAVMIQFFGYGYGFLRSVVILRLNPNKKAEELFPNLFFQ